MVRPKLPDYRRRERRLQVRLSEIELTALEDAAESCQVSVSTFMRDMTIRVAEAVRKGRLKPESLYGP